MTMNTEKYRIGELARRAGKTVRTIHFYEELELLHPTTRSKGGFRMYNDDALKRIHWIEKLQELGFSLTDIRDFLLGFQSQSTGPEAMDVLRTFYVEKLSETQSAIDRLLALQNELKASLAYLAVCQSCSSTHALPACSTCDDSEHDDGTPIMVAAIATSA